MISSVDLILERACKKALPRIIEKVEENIKRKKAKEKYLKRMKNGKRSKQ